MAGVGEEAGAQPHLVPAAPPPAAFSLQGVCGLVPNSPSAPHTDPPSVSATNAVVLAAVGEEAVLACEASGVPPPRVIWYRGTLGGGSGPWAIPLGPWRVSFPGRSWGALRMGCLEREDRFWQPHSHPQASVHAANAGWLRG